MAKRSGSKKRPAKPAKKSEKITSAAPEEDIVDEEIMDSDDEKVLTPKANGASKKLKPDENEEEGMETNQDSEHSEGEVDEDEEPKAKKGRGSKASGKAANKGKKGKKAPKVKAKTPKKKVEPESEPEDEEDVDYEVERIVDSKMLKNGSREFLIKWKGFSAKKNTWEPESNLDCPDIIDAFEKKLVGTKTTKKSAGNKRQSKDVEDDDVPKAKRGKKTTKAKTKKVEMDDAQYEVESILQVKNLRNGSREFLIKWKGFPKGKATWEPESNLDCPDIIEAFEKKHGDSGT